MASHPDQITFSFIGLQLSSSGTVTFIVGGAVSVLILAVAWRLVRR